MLILTRKPGESLFIGDEVKITVIEIKGNQIRIGISAPKDLRIYREEIYLQIIEENKEAAGSIESEEFSSLGGIPSTLETKGLVIKPISGMNLAKGKGLPKTSVRTVEGNVKEGFAKLSQSPSVVIKKKRNPSENES